MLRSLLRVFFQLLYHEFAWSYDLVAGMVSGGRWNTWIRAGMPFVEEARVLELAYGTGMLQAELRKTNATHVVGIDESRQMARLAQRRLRGGRDEPDDLTRGRAEALPFRSEAFDTVVATFPTEFIVAKETLDEARRVLAGSGRLVVVAAAWINGRRPLDRLAAWLFRSTQQSPSRPPSAAATDFAAPLREAGFKPAIHQVELRDSTVLVLVAIK